MRSLFLGMLFGAVMGGGLIGASLLESSSANAQDPHAEVYGKLTILSEVLAYIDSDYVTEIDKADVIEAGINGMLTSLDPHSGYLNAENYQEIQIDTSGQYGGLGIEIIPEKGFIKIVAPIDDTPASRAGLKSGDLLTRINGTLIAGMNMQDSVKKMRGEPGTDITITIVREGVEPFDVTLTREVIRPKYVHSRLEEGNIGYIRISGFNERTTLLLEEALAELTSAAKGRPTGLVLDLRNNPGGLLDQAVSVSGMFLSGGEVVSIFGRHPSNNQRYSAEAGEVFKDVPMIVLINRGSASASEIVAGALQDRARAMVLGMTSFGKGSVQNVFPLGGDKGAVRLTTARYYTPSGRSIQGTGIDPDIEVAQERVTEEELARYQRYTEADLPNALKNEEGSMRRGPHLPEDQPPETYEGEDYQLDRALQILREPGKFAQYATQTG